MNGAEKCPRCTEWTHKVFRFEGEPMCASCSEDITAQRTEAAERKQRTSAAELQRRQRENKIADNFRRTGLVR